RGGSARCREAAQGEDPARRARRQPNAVGRARALGANRRVPSRPPPSPRRPWADLVSGPGALATPRACLDEAPEVRRAGAPLPPQGEITLDSRPDQAGRVLVVDVEVLVDLVEHSLNDLVDDRVLSRRVGVCV